MLDLASGVGDPAIEVARRVGPLGRVVATDLVDAALDVLRPAARVDGLTWLETKAADMEGFSSVQEEHMEISWPFQGSAALYWEMFIELAGPTFQGAMAELEPKQQVELTDSIIRNLERFRQGAMIDPTATIVRCSGTSRKNFRVAPPVTLG